MMITLRKLPLAVAVAAGVMSAQALAVDYPWLRAFRHWLDRQRRRATVLQSDRRSK